MLSKDFRGRLRHDTQKLINSFLLFFLYTGSHPTCSVHLKFSYHARDVFCRGMCRLGLEGLWARRFEHAFGIFMWSVKTRLEPGHPASCRWWFSLAAALQTNKSMEKECGMENSWTCCEPCRGDSPNWPESSAEEAGHVQHLKTKNRQNNSCLQREWLLIKDSGNITKGNAFLMF